MTKLKTLIEEFDKAFLIYKKAVEAYYKNQNDILYKMALAKSFEMTFELSWHVLNEFLISKQSRAIIPKEIIQEGYRYELIKDVDMWKKMLSIKNIIHYENIDNKISTNIDIVANECFVELELFYNLIQYFD